MENRKVGPETSTRRRPDLLYEPLVSALIIRSLEPDATVAAAGPGWTVPHHGHDTTGAAAGTANVCRHRRRLRFDPIRRYRRPTQQVTSVSAEISSPTVRGWAWSHSSQTANGGLVGRGGVSRIAVAPSNRVE
jgi:hypothetical protein